MAYEKEIKKGVTGFGYVSNLRTFVQEANSLLSNEEIEFRSFEINSLIDDLMVQNRIEYKNKFGKPTTVENALYAVFPTAKKAVNGDTLIAYYDRQRIEKNWQGIFFTTAKELEKEVKDNLMFRLGAINFENWQDGLQFLEDLKAKCIPEKWSYRSHQSGIPHPILKSYIENTFEKLKVENHGSKILRSDDKKYVVFNTGLLDRFFHEIYIIVHVLEENGEI